MLDLDASMSGNKPVRLHLLGSEFVGTDSLLGVQDSPNCHCRCQLVGMTGSYLQPQRHVSRKKLKTELETPQPPACRLIVGTYLPR